MLRTTALATAAALTLSACAQTAANVQPAYVSSASYAGASCDQLRRDAAALQPKVAAAVDAQNSQATADAITVGVGLLVLWPVLLAVPMGNDSGELAALKGQVKAINDAALVQGCAL